MDRGSHFLGVIRVYHQGVQQLVGCAGEAAQDENALLVAARGDILLRDQIHAVVE